jgi:uncharacterized membrane protein YccC
MACTARMLVFLTVWLSCGTVGIIVSLIVTHDPLSLHLVGFPQLSGFVLGPLVAVCAVFVFLPIKR